MVEGITVVKFGMNDGGGNGRSYFGIEVRADASELTTMVVVLRKQYTNYILYESSWVPDSE